MLRMTKLNIRRHQAMLVIDVILELVAVVLHKRTHRHCGRVSKRTNCAALNVVSDRVQHVKIFITTFAVFDAIDHAPEPARAFTTRGALTARFFVIKIRQAQ